MHARPSTDSRPEILHQPHLRHHRFFALLAIGIFSLAVSTGLSGTVRAQGPPPPPPPEEEEMEAPTIADFVASAYPGEDNWLISGQIVDCSEPSEIAVTIGGAVSFDATTDFLGYFDVLLNYSGGHDLITADAEYQGTPLPQEITDIGY